MIWLILTAALLFLQTPAQAESLNWVLEKDYYSYRVSRHICQYKVLSVDGNIIHHQYEEGRYVPKPLPKEIPCLSGDLRLDMEYYSMGSPTVTEDDVLSVIVEVIEEGIAYPNQQYIYPTYGVRMATAHWWEEDEDSNDIWEFSGRSKVLTSATKDRIKDYLQENLDADTSIYWGGSTQRGGNFLFVNGKKFLFWSLWKKPLFDWFTFPY